jgi:hypothetical protein
MRRVAVGIAAGIAATALGTIPAEGGYSNTPERRDFATAGIVTQVEGVVFSQHGDSARATDLEVGSGLLVGDRIWVEAGALVRLTDTAGARITISGPAAVELARSVGHATLLRLFRGSMKLKSSVENAPVRFENAYVRGEVAGEGALWVAGGKCQLVGLAGEVRAWHPRLAGAPVLVRPGYFTETAQGGKQLEPRRPEKVDEAALSQFLARFDRSLEDREAPVVAPPSAENRMLASEKAVVPFKPVPVRKHAVAGGPGSRTSGDVVENGREGDSDRLYAHLRGHDYEDEEETPLLAPGSRLDAYGHPLQDVTRAPAATRAIPGIEIVKKTRPAREAKTEHDRELDAEEKLIVERLTGKKHKE